VLRRAFAAGGLALVPRHYHQPIPDERDLSEPFLLAGSELPGVDLNEPVALDLLRTVFPRSLDEFRGRFPVEQAAGRDGFWLLNGAFMAVDAHAYYALLRHLAPRRVVEIGGGFSSLIAAAAAERLRQEGRTSPELTVIEPFPSERLRRGLAGSGTLIASRVQAVPLSFFGSLQAGDVLFIDSTHVLRAGGDVQYEFLEILPRLAPGVLVHVHDVSLPRPYPEVYARDGLFWTEQYLLQAFLAFNSRFEVLWPGNWMMLNHADEMRRTFPEIEAMRLQYPQSEPTSFWMRVRAAA